ncbi:MAG: methyltransferase domain-containing protein [Nanoarchaeota archaeon]|nr:methyltransferase domain-containing protein [Nanoarchaeota archaeon]
MKLNLGCGVTKFEGYVNCDISPEVNPDKVVDLERKLPFKDNSVDEIVSNHVFAQINNFIPLMHELHRICKKGAVLKIKVPFYSYPSYYTDPTHVRFFTPFTFNLFSSKDFRHEVRAKEDMFFVRKNKINFSIGPLGKVNFLINPLINLNKKIYCRFFSWIFPAAEIEFELVVLK